jgi:putative transposase
MASMLYSLVRVVLDAIATSHSNEAKLRVEVLALRRQVQVLERQIKRVRWEPGDRMILAALRERLPRSAWAALLVQPETVLGLASRTGSTAVGSVPRSPADRSAAAG